MESKLFQKVNYCDGSSDGCLDVRFTPDCFASCGFCIAAEDMKVKRTYDEEAMLASLLKTENTSLSIIGGEPLLHLQRLLAFMGRVEEEAPQVKDFYVTTALPATVKTQPRLFAALMGRVTTLNVTLHHMDPDVNNSILKTKSKLDRPGLLRELLASHPEWRSKVRVHLNLTREGIATGEELWASLALLREWGVEEVKVNELMNAPEDYISFEEVTGMDLPSPYYHGCSTPLDFFPGVAVTLKRSCFVVEPSRQASKLDLLKLEAKSHGLGSVRDLQRMRVLYEDGTLAPSWLDGQPV